MLGPLLATLTLSTTISLLVATVYSFPPVAFVDTVTSILFPATTVVLWFAALFTADIASWILFCPVPPILLVVIVPSGFNIVFPPIEFLILSATPWSWLPFTASLLVAVISPFATFVTFLFPASIPALVTEGPPLIVSPLSSILVSPVLTLPLVPKSIFSASFTFRVFVVLSASTPIFPLVRFPVAPPFIFRVSPSFLSILLPLSPVNVIGLLTAAFRLLIAFVLFAIFWALLFIEVWRLVWTSWSCPPFIASLLPAAIVPSATFVTFLLPASTPADVILGPFTIVNPPLFSKASPILKLPAGPRFRLGDKL